MLNVLNVECVDVAGVDAGEFARSVMTQSQAFIAAARAGNEEIPGPADVIRAAWGETVDKNIVGSSTALVAYIDSVRSRALLCRSLTIARVMRGLCVGAHRSACCREHR